MLEARFADGASFKKLVDALKDYKEINLECDEHGIRSKVMDECHVSLADLRLSSLVFEYYSCDSKCVLGLNVETLTKFSRLAPSEVPFSLRKLKEIDTLQLESDEDVETGLKRAAHVRLIQVTSETLSIPDQNYQVEIDIPTKVYALIFKDLSGAAEDVVITVTSNSIKFDADGDRGRVENIFYRGQGAFASSNWFFDIASQSSSLQQTFALRFLSGFSKACPLSDTVTLSMSPGVPMRLQFSLGDESHLSYYIAPAFQ